MSKTEKILQKFLSKPKNFKRTELTKLLKGFGYKEMKGGKSSGSRTTFYNKETESTIKLHKPHPQPTLKPYQLELIEKILKGEGVI